MIFLLTPPHLTVHEKPRNGVILGFFSIIVLFFFNIFIEIFINLEPGPIHHYWWVDLRKFLEFLKFFVPLCCSFHFFVPQFVPYSIYSANSNDSEIGRIFDFNFWSETVPHPQILRKLSPFLLLITCKNWSLREIFKFYLYKKYIKTWMSHIMISNSRLEFCFNKWEAKQFLDTFIG